MGTLGLFVLAMTWAPSYNGDPDINIKNGGDIPNGGAYDFGNQDVGSNTDVTFTIENLGSEDLYLGYCGKKNPQSLDIDLITIAGLNADQFIVTQQPLISTIPPSGSTTFVIRFSPTSTGAKIAAVSTAPTNDPDEGTYSFTINGTGTVNTPPTITNIPNQTTNEDTPTPPIPFTIGDAETSPFGLGVHGTSQNTSLIPNENLAFGGTDQNRTLTVTPAPDAFGSTLISVFVTDPEGAYAQKDFWINVTPVNDPPTLGDIPNQTTNEDVPLQFDLDVNDVDDTFGDLIMMGSNFNRGLVDDITFANGTSGTRGKTSMVPRATITPLANANGETDVVISASDGEFTASDTFHLTINPVNDAPQFLVPLPPITLVQGEHYEIPMLLLYQIVEDVDNPDPTLVWSVIDRDRFTPVITADLVMFDAPTDWTGTDTLTVTVSDGELSASTPLIVSVVTSVDEISGSGVPTSFTLYQNHPNPFNPVTTISFGLPKPSHVSLSIYNGNGRHIQTLLDGNKSAGIHAITWDASSMSSGIYFYKIQTPDFTQVKKCMLMK
jgi:hypothetical protein